MKRILTSIWFSGLVVVVPLILLLLPEFDKYQVELVDKDRKTENDANKAFYDLNGDGKFEDNEIGRMKSMKMEKEGFIIVTKAVKEILHPQNETQKHKITQQVIDLYDSDWKASGTCVEIIGST